MHFQTCVTWNSILHLSFNVWTIWNFVFSTSLQETYETKRKEFLCELQKKEEEMRQMFVNKVKETESELKEKEREVSMAETMTLRDKFLH